MGFFFAAVARRHRTCDCTCDPHPTHVNAVHPTHSGWVEGVTWPKPPSLIESSDWGSDVWMVADEEAGLRGFKFLTCPSRNPVWEQPRLLGLIYVDGICSSLVVFLQQIGSKIGIRLQWAVCMQFTVSHKPRLLASSTLQGPPRAFAQYTTHLVLYGFCILSQQPF